MGNYEIRALLKRHEGCTLRPVADPAGDGSLVIGYGRNLNHRGITQAEADLLLLNDVEEGRRFIWGKAGHQIGEAREAALVDCYHALGSGGLNGFKRMWEAIAGNDWTAAAAELLDSKWARGYPSRVEELARILESNRLPGDLME